MDPTVVESAFRLHKALQDNNVYAVACIDNTAKKIIAKIIDGREPPTPLKQEFPGPAEPATVESLLSDLDTLITGIYDGACRITHAPVDMKAIRAQCQEIFQNFFEEKFQQLEEQISNTHTSNDESVRSLISEKIAASEAAQLNTVRPMIAAASRNLSGRVDRFEKTVLGSYRALLMGKIGAAAQMPKMLQDIQSKLAVVEVLERKITALGYSINELNGKTAETKHDADHESLRDMVGHVKDELNAHLLSFYELKDQTLGLEERTEGLEVKTLGLAGKTDFGIQELMAKTTDLEKKVFGTEEKTQLHIQRLLAKLAGLETKCDQLTLNAPYQNLEQLGASTTSLSPKEVPSPITNVAPISESADLASLLSTMKKDIDAATKTHFDLFITSMQMQIDEIRSKVDGFQEKTDGSHKKVDVQSGLEYDASKVDEMASLRRELEELKMAGGHVMTEEKMVVLLNHWAKKNNFLTEAGISQVCNDICESHFDSALKYAISTGRVASKMAPQGPVNGINPTAAPFTPKWAENGVYGGNFGAIN
ncbi:hypothetical protein HYFRA_00007567 [Hymenoscyphus fraxineus]|uniref:Uncharacterized protein n=1 Tax=Hymenoscyphus fraxineus TaxID=746836 RepID=A0A9N9PRX9_9HELO|nr:hypothetical protein HYFRA_00007567 [Hymenoscyphus fraxineus]